MFHADNAYFLPQNRIYSRRVKTNTVSNTAFRGFGGPQGMLAIERVIDAIAWKLGLDPLDVRKANLYARRPRRHPVWPNRRRPRCGGAADRAARTLVELPRAAKGDRGIQCAISNS